MRRTSSPPSLALPLLSCKKPSYRWKHQRSSTSKQKPHRHPCRLCCVRFHAPITCQSNHAGDAALLLWGFRANIHVQGGLWKSIVAHQNRAKDLFVFPPRDVRIEGALWHKQAPSLQSALRSYRCQLSIDFALQHMHVRPGLFVEQCCNLDTRANPTSSSVGYQAPRLANTQHDYSEINGVLLAHLSGQATSDGSRCRCRCRCTSPQLPASRGLMRSSAGASHT